MLTVKAWHVPLRLVSGVFVLNSGLNKRGVTGDAAAAYHGMASGAFPQFKSVDAEQFTRYLSLAECTIGTALLLPFVPSGLAGAALAGFAGGLLRLYWKTPGMRQEGDFRPTEQGIGLAKDMWLFGIACALVIDALTHDD